MFQFLVVGSSRSAIHCGGPAYFHAAFHQQVNRNYHIVRSTVGQLDFTVCSVIKAASIALSHNQERNPTLFQEFPLPSAILLDRRHISTYPQKIVIQETDQELLFQEHFGFVVQYFSCLSHIFVGPFQAKYFLIRFFEHRIGPL